MDKQIDVLAFRDRSEFARWLDQNHASSSGIWLRFAKKNSGITSVTYSEAVEVALCYGWIDGQSKSEDDQRYLQKFVPRARRSVWSKINRDKALALIESGKMMPAGLAEVERAKLDGRWDAAYDSPKGATVPADLQAALQRDDLARRNFESLDGRNRYAILHRIQLAKKPETRARRIEEFVRMLARNERLYP